MSDKKPKVPALALNQKILAQAAEQSFQETDCETKAGTDTQHSFYTTREATQEYVIKGIQDKNEKDSSQSERSAQENNLQEDKKKKKRRRKNKKGKEQAVPTPKPTETEKPKQEALRDNIDPNELFGDSDQSEDEGIADYKIGGYHPVHVGEVLIDRYVILQKLGWGHFSTVWLARDLKYQTFVALKVQKSAPHYQEAAYDEVEILDVVHKNSNMEKWVKEVMRYKGYKNKSQYSLEDCHCVQLLNSFVHSSANGSHFVMVFEILGVNLLEIMKRYDYRGIPMPIVRRLAKQCLIGLDYLHSVCHIIHTDLKPENVVVGLSDKELQQIHTSGRIGTSSQNVDSREAQKLFKIEKEVVVEQQDTEGLTKNQKKKLKAKAKKQEKQEEAQTEREDLAQSHMHDQKKQEQEATNSEGEEMDEDIEQPRSHSLPNMIWRAATLEEPVEKEGEWQYVFQRDFPNEIQEYFHHKEKQGNQEPKKEKLPENMHQRGPLATEDIKLKICDLGNGCWTHHHFTTKIQTRQYRSPEVMLGLDYDTSADLWSFACMMFELITGDFLFDPRKGEKGADDKPVYSKSDDHLAQMIEMLGSMPRSFAMGGSFFNKFFKKSGDEYVFARIGGLVHFPLERILIEKHRLYPKEAKELADFLMSILKWFPNDRASAHQMLDHPWIKMEDNYDTRMSDLEFQKYHLKVDQGTPDGPWWMQGTAFDDVDICKLAREDIFYGDDDEKDSSSSSSSSDGIDSLNSETEDLSQSKKKKKARAGSLSLGSTNSGEHEEEFNLNVSFSGGYLPNTDLSRVDKGAGNPQFAGFKVAE